MGQFSWIDVDGNQNIAEGEKGVIMLIPNEHKTAVSKVFGVEIAGNGIEGEYSGYGEVVDKNGVKIDVFDVMTFINICLTTDKQYEQAIEQMFRKPSMNCSNEVRKRCAKQYIKEYMPIREAYQNGKIQSAADLFAISGDEHSFRHIGIMMTSYEEQNARTPYPIKWTVNKDNTYENSKFSVDDPSQGFFKVNITSWEDYKEACEKEGMDETEEQMRKGFAAYSKDYARLEKKRNEILEEIRSEREQEQEEEQELECSDEEKSDDDLGLD